MSSGATGAATGAIGGAGAGSVAGGVGALPGAIIGGIFGFAGGLLKGMIMEATGVNLAKEQYVVEPVTDFLNKNHTYHPNNSAIYGGGGNWVTP